MTSGPNTWQSIRDGTLQTLLQSRLDYFLKGPLMEILGAAIRSELLNSLNLETPARCDSTFLVGLVIFRRDCRSRLA